MKNLCKTIMISLVITVCCSNLELNSQILKYRTAKKEDISFMNTSRMVNRVILDVSSAPSDQEMKNTATHIWANGNKTWQEFTVFMYLPGMDIESVAFGVGEFRPYGLLRFNRNEYSLMGTKWEKMKSTQPIKETPTQGLKEYKIEISAIKAGENKVKINIATNFPDGTNLFLSIFRIYYVKGDGTGYSGGLAEEVFTIKNGQYEKIIPISDTEWYNRSQKVATSIPGDFPPISKISDKITIEVMYTPARPQPPNVITVLGKRGEFVTGNGASQFGTGTAGRLTSLSSFIEFFFPFGK